MSQRIADTFDKRAGLIKKTMEHYKGVLPDDLELVKGDEAGGLLSAAAIKENTLLDFKDCVAQMEALRTGSKDRRCVNADFGFMLKHKMGFGSQESFFHALEIDPSFHTISSLSTMGEMPEGYRWIVPEIFREAIRLGLRKAPIYQNLIAAEENVAQPKVIMPSVNMSAATPAQLNETETIPVGNVSFNQKDVRLRKIGTGIRVSDEVIQFVSLNLVSLYLQDVGIKLGLGLDTMAIDVLLNGEQVDGSMSAPTIGVANTSAGIQYNDILRAWIRMNRLGRTPSTLLSNEDAAVSILNLAEFKGGMFLVQKQQIQFKTPIPQTQDYYVHGAMPDSNFLGILSKDSGLIKLNAMALKVESERIVNRQINGSYATVMTGFAKMFRDGFVCLDGTIAYSGNGYPDWMNVGAAEQVLFS